MAAEFKLSGFSAVLGFELKKVGNGAAELAILITPQLLNTAATVHGGVLASLADSVAGAAAFSAVPREKFCITSDLHMTYLKSVGEGELQCFGTVIHQSRRKLAVEASICQGETLVAKAQVSFMVVERRKPFDSTVDAS